MRRAAFPIASLMAPIGFCNSKPRFVEFLFAFLVGFGLLLPFEANLVLALLLAVFGFQLIQFVEALEEGSFVRCFVAGP